MNEFAQDAKASVRVRHFPLQSPSGGTKAAWDVFVSQQGIDRDSGEVSNAAYSMSVLMDGTQTEFIGADRAITVQGDDSLVVQGDRTVSVVGDESREAGGEHIQKAGSRAVVEAPSVLLGSRSATEPAVLGNMLQAFLSTAMWKVAPLPDGSLATVGPPLNIAQFATVLASRTKVQ
jgi:hypothetical protein